MSQWVQKAWSTSYTSISLLGLDNVLTWEGSIQNKKTAQRFPPTQNDNTCNAVGIPPPITYTYLETRFNKRPEILFLNIEKG